MKHIHNLFHTPAKKSDELMLNTRNIRNTFTPSDRFQDMLGIIWFAAHPCPIVPETPDFIGIANSILRNSSGLQPFDRLSDLLVCFLLP